ncbi:hypothetical protein C8J57DRAFT_998859, partial [Mycena rebaudengoi]
MVNSANKFGAQFDTLLTTQELKGKLPLWHHFGENRALRQLNNKPQSKCLRNIHGVHTIGSGMRTMQRLNSEDHAENQHCECNECTEDRSRGCRNSHSCAAAVQARLEELLPKW